MPNPLEPIKRMYSRLNYYEFCEYLDLDPKYSKTYWDRFQELIHGLSAFDNDRLQKMLDFGKENHGQT